MIVGIKAIRTKTQNQIVVWPNSSTEEKNFFFENEEYVFEIEAPSHSGELTLFIDDVEVLALRPSQEGNSRWLWTSDFFAGSIDFEIFVGKRRVFSRKIILSPSKHKLTYSEFELMLTQILNESETLFALGQTKITMSSGREYSTPITKLEFLRSNFAQLQKTIGSILENPVTVLRSDPDYVRPEKYRGSIDPNRIPIAFGTYGAVEHVSGFLPAQLPIDVKSDQLDIYEHQCIKHCLHVWSSWLRQIARSIRSSSNLTEPTASKWAKRAFELSFKLDEICSNDFFSKISEFRGTGIVPTNIFTSVPQYRSFFDLQRKLNLGVGKSLGDFLNVPISKTYQLYEVWCFFRIISAFRLKGYDVEDVAVRKNSSELVSSSVLFEVRFTNFSLVFQKRFDEYWKAEDGVGSFSRVMIPDISLSFESNGSPHPSSIVFDAKYRVETALNDAISSAHMYRDAIVSESEGEVNRRVVGSYLLTPQVQKSHRSEWKTETAPQRFFHPSFLDTFKFGVLSFHPTMRLEDVADNLEKLVLEQS